MSEYIPILERLFGKDSNVKFQFWTCPKGCQGYIEWTGNVATCKDCGCKSTDEPEDKNQ